MLSAAGAGSALGAGHTEQTHHVGAVPPSFAQPFRALGPSLRGLSLPPGCRHAGAPHPRRYRRVPSSSHMDTVPVGKPTASRPPPCRVQPPNPPWLGCGSTPGRRRPAALHGAATWPAALHLLARSASVRLRSRLPTETYVLSGRHPAAWIARQRAGSVLATPRAIAKPSRSTLWRVTQQRAVSAAQKRRSQRQLTGLRAAAASYAADVAHGGSDPAHRTPPSTQRVETTLDAVGRPHSRLGASPQPGRVRRRELNRPLESDARRDMRHDRREPARPGELFVATLH